MLLFIDKYNIIKSTQLGFRSDHCLNRACIYLTDLFFTYLDNCYRIVNIILDIKAFDSWDHNGVQYNVIKIMYENAHGLTYLLLMF